MLFSSSPAFAIEFSSGNRKVQLIELYTSQSCSSCPPAEKWISELKRSSQLWSDFIPLAYHVSYWNYLSWKDPFSKEEYSERQREYHSVIQRGVYTPQIILSGSDQRQWQSKTASDLKSNMRPGKLEVKVDKQFVTAEIKFNPLQKFGRLNCFGAYIESGHTTNITSGENDGRQLVQDFVVVDLFKGPTQKAEGGLTCKIDLKFDKKRSSKEKGLVFWLVDKSSYEVIQATGGLIK